MTMMLIDSENFRRRCASALTHPVTLAALVALLLNDGLFKSLWPDSWVTGKLSDLAWVVFASPLLAFVMSLFLSRRAFTRRATVLVSYVGLPALYAAFNTFEPVQDRILWGLSLVAGGTAGSPLDPTDSLVIPFGLGIAWWVWRRRPVGPDRLRVRLAMLAAGVATFATVATSYQVTDTGIESVGIGGDGTIVAAGKEFDRPYQYRSTDAGFTWQPVEVTTNVNWGSEEVETRRGKYVVRGSEVLVLTVHGERELIFSAADPQKQAKSRVQEPAATQSGRSRIDAKAYGIVYDERSGNLIAAMGHEGVAVGSSDGRWASVAVGEYGPTDYSSRSQTLVLLSAISLLATAIALSASMTAISTVVSQYRKEDVPLAIGATLAYLALGIGLPGLIATREVNAEISVAAIALYFVAIFGSAMYLGSESKLTLAWKGLALALAMYCVIVSGVFLWSFDASDDLLRTFTFVGVATLTVIFALAAMRIPWRQVRHRKAVLSAFAGINGLVILVFLMWAQLGFGLTYAKVSAIVLVALVAIALTTHLKRKQQPG